MIDPTLLAVLVRLSNGAESWDTSFEQDPERIAYHEKKMKSKDERPRQQMELLGLNSGKVLHVVDI